MDILENNDGYLCVIKEYDAMFPILRNGQDMPEAEFLLKRMILSEFENMKIKKQVNVCLLRNEDDEVNLIWIAFQRLGQTNQPKKYLILYRTPCPIRIRQQTYG